ncbi:hypothetical protein FPZ12_019225 [Amycolatopsis acidicola]|uniref:UspA domain-containing protein n=1 Tax=Amycolatopsis acidicola TaxID=2596893 RepID=A0A5N0V3Z6_9PSEU|nr:universal stress protein [Amycolatopsis acidicola]KAA9159764.1 hypothetical protein FPZ12_019225 [Amycolatopsis acidicola]
MSEVAVGPVVVGVDGSEASLRAVRWAAREARWRHTRLRIVHAVEPPAFHFTKGYVDTAGVLVKLRAEGRRIVAEAAVEVAAAGAAGAGVSGAQVPGAQVARAEVFGAEVAGAGAPGGEVPGAVVSGADVAGAEVAGAGVAGVGVSGVGVSGADVAGAEVAVAGAPAAGVPGAEVFAANVAGGGVPGAEVETEVSIAAPAKALLAESRGAQLLVLGMTGQSAFPGLMVGSLPAMLAAHAYCPVTVVRGESRPGPVVAGIDGGPLSDAVVGMAIEEAAHRGVPLIAAHAWSDADFDGGAVQPYFGWEPVAEAEKQVLAESLAGWQDKYPDVTVDRVAVRDRPRHLLLEWSRTAQLVVVGSRGRGGFAGLLLGSTGQALVHHAQGPVLVVRS